MARFYVGVALILCQVRPGVAVARSGITPGAIIFQVTLHSCAATLSSPVYSAFDRHRLKPP